MRRIHRVVLMTALLALAPALAACENFDMDKLDFFNSKKPLPGKRELLFPNGVPGVSQGIPKQYMKGYEEQSQQQSIAATPLPGQSNPPPPPAATATPQSKTAALTPEQKKKAAEEKAKKKKKAAKHKAKPKPKPKPSESAGQSQWPPSSQGQIGIAPWPSTPQSNTTSH
jgi:outer membrane biosynthesis protein TonB